MRSRFRSFPKGDRLAVAVLLLAAACGADVSETASAPGTASPPGAAPDRVIAGPQGDVGQFVVECAFSHFLADDPIVHPGEPGASHLHQFFGSTIASVDSTEADMLAGDTTCEQRLDTASYWTPVLVDGDHEPIEPIRSVAYYRAGIDVDPTTVVAYPPGFMMVAGDHTAVEPQPVSVVAWSCGIGAVRSPTPPDCAGADTLRMAVTFPDCWNGVDVRSPIVREPSGHVAYSSAGTCPPEHPVAIPQLRFAVDYPPVATDELDHLALSSGDILTGHADFWNVWHQGKLEREVDGCIRRDLACGLGS